MDRALHKLSGCFPSIDSDARRRSREIDAWLKKNVQTPVLIFLVGTTNAGKSTFIKQIRLINGDEFNHTERLQYREAIYNNIIEGMRMLVEERNKLGIPLQNSANKMHEILLTSIEPTVKFTDPSTFQPYVEAVDSLWKDSGIQEAQERKCEFNYFERFYESVKYFFENIHRIGQLNYLPHNQDIIYTHKLRTMQEEGYFVLRDTPIAVRHFSRWHFRRMNFSCANTVIFFIIGSSDYDRLFEERNCLDESLRVFQIIINDKFFRNCTIILFFNKMDLLAEKILTADIRKHFPEFQGDPHRLEDVQEFLVQSFKERKRQNCEPVYYHMTTAVDTENFQTVFNAVKNAILSYNFQNIPLL